MMLTGLADVLRDGGCTVREEPGWKTRGHGPMAGVSGVVWHHTASSTAAANDIRVIRDGRSDLPGPLSHLYLGRDGTFTVIAAGGCWHAGSGNWPGIPQNRANYYTVGIEAAQRGTGAEPWVPAQLAAYRKGALALTRHYDGITPSTNFGHKEWTSRKVDPWGIDMAAERRRIANELNEGPTVPEDKDWKYPDAAGPLLEADIYSKWTGPGANVDTDNLAAYLTRLLRHSSGLVRVDNAAQVYQLVGEYLVPITSSDQAKVVVAGIGGAASRWQQYVQNISAADAAKFTRLKPGALPGGGGLSSGDTFTATVD